MRDRKLYDLLGRLSVAERKNFAEFLRSPLHAHRPRLGELVELMEKMLYQQPEAEVSSEAFYAAYNPGQRFDPNNLNRLISVITTEFKQYLGLLCYQRDRAAQMANTVREYSRRHWNDLLQSEIDLVREQLPEAVPEDEHSYYQMMRVEREAIGLKTETMQNVVGAYFEDIIKCLDRFMIITRLRYMTLAAASDVKYGTKHNVSWGTIIDEETLDNACKESTVVRLFLAFSRLPHKGFDYDAFQEFSNDLHSMVPDYRKDRSIFHKIEQADAQTLYTYCLNYCNRLTNIDRALWNEEYIRLNTEILEKGVALEDGYLSSKTFLNHIQLLSNNGRTKEAEEFLKENIQMIYQKDRDLFENLALAYIKFKRNEKKEALTILLQAKNRLAPSSEIVVNLEIRLLICLCWHNEGDIDAMGHEINSMRTFISRSTIATKRDLTRYSRFVKAVLMVERLERSSASKRHRNLQKTLKNLDTYPNFTARLLIRQQVVEKLEKMEQQGIG